MTSHKPPLVEGVDYQLLDSGVIVVGRNFSNLEAPYLDEPIPDYLGLVDHNYRIEKKSHYQKALYREENEFNRLVYQLKEKGRSLVVVLQGRDAAGKSGAAKRLMEALDYDMKVFDWIPIFEPTQDELTHPYLWRFCVGERLPKFGQVRVFDRSWFERVLVEKVDKLTKPSLLQRSYGELRMFERLLQSQGVILVKFWMDITKQEQGRRFQERRARKPRKLGKNDRKARKQWPQYSDAANEMFYRTGTQSAPWNLLPADDKWHSRVTFLQVINEQLRQALA